MSVNGKPARFGRLPRTASDADVARALSDLRELWSPTPRQRAERRLDLAKERMRDAAQAVLDKHPDAARIGDEALEEFTAAQAALRLIDESDHG
jgi:hypothetical protein